MLNVKTVTGIGLGWMTAGFALPDPGMIIVGGLTAGCAAVYWYFDGARERAFKKLDEMNTTAMPPKIGPDTYRPRKDLSAHEFFANASIKSTEKMAEELAGGPDALSRAAWHRYVRHYMDEEFARATDLAATSISTGIEGLLQAKNGLKDPNGIVVVRLYTVTRMLNDVVVGLEGVAARTRAEADGKRK